MESEGDREKTIWEELEKEVKSMIKEEIKQGICHLVLRLHRLRIRNSSNSQRVCITIRLEGGSDQFEIREIKTEALGIRKLGREKGLRRSSTTAAATGGSCRRNGYNMKAVKLGWKY
ncbi:hypothetical protein LINGRAHAP2_LOCUS12481 [Linum grandiflorum]